MLAHFWNIPWALQLHFHFIFLECLPPPFVYWDLIIFKWLLILFIFDYIFPNHLGQKQFLFFSIQIVYFEPCICCYSHIALDSNLSNLFYYISIILNIRNCKSQDRLGYGTSPTMTKIQWVQMQMYNSISSELGFHSIILCHVESG